LSSRPRSKTEVDFFRYGALPVPRVTVEEAERLAASSFGLMVRARPPDSQQDSNLLPVEADGQVAGVLKIANPAFTMAEIEAQDADFFADALDQVLTQGWCLRSECWRACWSCP